MLSKDFREFIELLNENNVEYYLKLTKEKAGRHQDLADIENLNLGRGSDLK